MKRYNRFLFATMMAVSFATSGTYKSVLAEEHKKTDHMDANAEFQGKKPLSIEEQFEWITEQTVAAKDVSRLVQQMLDQAQKDKDTIKIVSLNDILTQILVNLRGIEKREEAHRIAADRGDIAAASHHFSVIAVYFKRISRLGADADKIVGGKDIVFGKTETTLTVDSYITDEDPSEYSFDFDIVMEQPPHASGFY